MMFWYVWVRCRVYKMFSDGETIRYEGYGPYEVKQQPKKVVEINPTKRLDCDYGFPNNRAGG